jgi:hypothetical protein
MDKTLSQKYQKENKVYTGHFIMQMFQGSNHVFLENTELGRLTDEALETAVDYYYKIGGNDDRDITREHIRQQIKEGMMPCTMEKTEDGRVRIFYTKLNTADTFSPSNIFAFIRRPVFINVDEI